MFVTEHVVSTIISMSLYSKTDVVEGDGPNPAMHNNPRDLWLVSQRISFRVEQLLHEGTVMASTGWFYWLKDARNAKKGLKTISA